MPLRVAVYLGLLAVAVGLVHSAWWLVQAMLGMPHGPADFEYLILATHLLGGGILCALGIVGEYIGRIFDQVKGRPLYVLKDESPAFSTGAALPPKRREAA